MVKGLTIDVTADTNNLSARLKAIAKHATALADELDEINQCEELDVPNNNPS